MSGTPYDLIGKIIHPSPAPRAPAHPVGLAAAAASEPLDVLIGRVISAPGAPPARVPAVRLSPVAPAPTAPAAASPA